jgi:hypothetical protein
MRGSGNNYKQYGYLDQPKELELDPAFKRHIAIPGGNPSNSADVIDVIAGNFKKEETHPITVTRPEGEVTAVPAVSTPVIIPTDAIVDIPSEIKAELAQLPPDTPIEITNESTGITAVTTTETFLRETFSYSDKDTHLFGESNGVNRNKSFAHAQFSALIPGTDTAVDFRPDNSRNAIVPTRLVQGSFIDAIAGFARDPKKEVSVRTVLNEGFKQRERFANIKVDTDTVIKAFKQPAKALHKTLRIVKKGTTETFGEGISWNLLSILLLVILIFGVIVPFCMFLCKIAKPVIEKIKGELL